MRCAFRSIRLAFLGSVALFAASCSSEDPPMEPPPPPTILKVHVTDGSTGAPLAARVTLVESGIVIETNSAGDAERELEPGVYSYRAQAAGYLGSPRYNRPARYISVLEEKTVELHIALEPRPGAVPGGTLSGSVTQGGAPVKGALIVATATGYFSAVTDAEGRYLMLGVSPDFYIVTAYLPGYSSMPKTNIEVKAGMAKEGIDLDLSVSAGATISGMISGGSGTSSVAIVQAQSGEVVPGLSTRATLGNGTYSIDGVPPGTYRIVSGLELDGVTYDAQWVLDNGAPTVMVADTSSKTVDLRFTSAITGISPAGSSTVAEVMPTLTWPAVPMANFYVVEVRNVNLQVVHGGFDVRGAPRETVLAPATSFTLRMPLVRGALYSWRVFAAKDVTTGSLFELLSASEELDGQFRISR